VDLGKALPEPQADGRSRRAGEEEQMASCPEERTATPIAPAEYR
jgi:hypothetical protein